MQFSESWLRSFCNPALSTEALGELLTMAGMEVEEIVPVAPPFTGVVVGAIQSVAQHPNADRLRVCTVDVGAAEPLSIVCGAPNARVGIRVPCAQVGAELPPAKDSNQKFTIKVGKLRGVESYGMLCSSTELGLPAGVDGLLELPADAPIGQDIRTYLDLDDKLFTLKLTPNLGHCLSVYGIARELSALTGEPLKTLQRPVIAASQNDVKLPVRLEAKDLCSRFTGRVLQNISNAGSSPAWLVQRLERCGQKSISPLVDISNYVMFEYGQPSHIFDLSKIQGDLIIRWGKADEKIDLLNNTNATIDEKVGVVADATAAKALAGIMGGLQCAVQPDTTDIYIEVANWFPDAISGRARKLGISSDASHRFERGVDPANTDLYLDRLTDLILQICGTSDTVVGPVDDQVFEKVVPPTVRLRNARAEKVLGIPLGVDVCVDYLRRLGFVCNVQGDEITVRAPAYRYDINIEEDLIEEVAKLYGYNNIVPASPLGVLQALDQPAQKKSAWSVKEALARLGYFETINYSFISAEMDSDVSGKSDAVRLLNPIASHMNVMRTSVVGSLLLALKNNLVRNQDRVRLFEVGRVFLPDASVQSGDLAIAGFHQPVRVGGLAYGSAIPSNWYSKERVIDFFDVKGDVEILLGERELGFAKTVQHGLHPGRSASIQLAGREIGWIGELHPELVQKLELPKAPIVFELDWDAVLERANVNFAPISKYQTVQRDIAIWVSDDVTYHAIMAAIRESVSTELLQDVGLFDVFKPHAADAQKSMALRMKIGSQHGNLTDQQIDEVVQSVIDALSSRVQAKLRS